MIIKSDTRETRQIKTGDESSFKIKASAQAFKILADNLYSNKIRAIVRELICNAYDSHIESGTSAAFQVILPSYESENFTIRDFGVGISHDFMMDGYTTLFHSTKEETNDQVGGFGLGRLSAFSYTDSYTVASDFDGKRRTYAVFLQSNGFPKITLMSEEDSDRTGFEVNIPVKEGDFTGFKRELVGFLTHCEGVNYEVSKEAADLIEGERKRTLFHKGENYEILTGSPGRIFVKMGLVVYDTGLSFPYRILVNLPIGAVPVSPTRESISYADGVQNIISSAAFKAREDFELKIQEQIDSASCLWDACLIQSRNAPWFYAKTYKGNKFEELLKGCRPVSVTNHKARESVYFLSSDIPDERNKYYIDDNPKYRRKRLLLVGYCFIFPQGYDFSALGKSDFPLLSSIAYDPPKRSYTASKSIGISYLCGSEWVPFGQVPKELKWYISCPYSERKDLTTSLLRTINNLSILGSNPSNKFHWISPRSLKTYKSIFPEMEEYSEHLIKLEKELIDKKFPDGIPSISELYKFRGLSKIGDEKINTLLDQVSLGARLKGKKTTDRTNICQEYVNSHRILRLLGDKLNDIYDKKDIEYIKSLCTQ